MNITGLIIFIGAAAGCLAGAFMKNWGSGLLRNVLVGSIGGAAVGILLKSTGLFSGGSIGTMAAAAVGAAALLSVIARLKNRKQSSIHYKGDELWVRRKPLNRR